MIGINELINCVVDMIYDNCENGIYKTIKQKNIILTDYKEIYRKKSYCGIFYATYILLFLIKKGKYMCRKKSYCGIC